VTNYQYGLKLSESYIAGTVRIIFIKHFVLPKIPLIFVPVERTINETFL
jgi:hypothetical protein